MFIKNHQLLGRYKAEFINSTIFIFISTATTFAQVRSIPVQPRVAPVPTEDFTWWYVSLFILAIGLAGAIFWWLNSKKAQRASAAKFKELTTDEREMKAVDADKELEWLRKNQQFAGRKNKRTPQRKKRQGKTSPQVAATSESNDSEQVNAASDAVVKHTPALPIFSIHRLELARPFDALPISNDEDLMGAVEQAYDEFEEDDEVRDLAIRILTAFRKRNSVEALSQIALYDLSSNLRSKAVSVLADFDHESVFETILLANADPTREVRAAAARGLTKLSCDRADAWTRIAETGEEGRVAQAARAAIESGFVDMSFDRLISMDHKQAYEAFTLMALLIKAGETDKIFYALEKHKDMNVRKVILHIIKVIKDKKVIDGLYQLLERGNLPVDLQEEIGNTIETIEEADFVTA